MDGTSSFWRAVPEVRPGFTCTAEITTATRAGVVAVPIQATTVREKIIDKEGNIVPPDTKAGSKRRPAAVLDSDLKPGQERKELEGVFIVKDNKAVFMPVTTGPFSSVRELAEGAAVKIEAASRSTAAKK